jgi:transcriptional regulator with XRE-family HTH domain
MQELFPPAFYVARMAAKKNSSPLRSLREAAGMSQRELARQIGQDQSNVRYWEATGKIPRSDVLAPIAAALGVTVQELLGEPAPKRAATPAGKLGRLVETLGKLPRRQQDKMIDVIETLLAGQQAKSGKAA